jgi:hypothetical protein
MNPEIEPLPQFSTDLIDLLDRLYPAVCAQPNEDREIALHYSGMRALIDELKSWREEVNARPTQ